MDLLSVTFVASVVAAGNSGAGQSDGKYPEWNDLSLRGFSQEVLFGHGTQRTHLFDAYTEGSYSVQPPELAAELPKQAALYDLELRALVVVGSYGPLWSYNVVAFLPSEKCVRVNWLVMAHARVTMKRTGCIADAVAEDWLSSIRATAEIGGLTQDLDDYDSCVLLADLDEGRPNFRRSKFSCWPGESKESKASIEALWALLNELLPTLELTYSAYPPVDEQ